MGRCETVAVTVVGRALCLLFSLKVTVCLVVSVLKTSVSRVI